MASDNEQPDRVQATPRLPKRLDHILGTLSERPATPISTYAELARRTGEVIERYRAAIKNARSKRLKQAAVSDGVKKLLKKYPNLAIQHAARLLGCSVGAVAKTPEWRKEMLMRKRPKIKPLDEEVLDNAADPGEVLDRLTKDQRQEQLEDEGLRRVRKRL